VPGGAGGAGTGDRRTVWVLRTGQPVPVPIKTGITDGTFTEVVQGELHEGDDIITEASSEPTGQPPPALRL
jgi:HlyD family secretion protein